MTATLPTPPAPRVEVLDRTDSEAYLTTRALLDFGVDSAGWNPGNLTQVRESASALRTLLDPQEIERPLGHGLLAYDHGKATFRVMDPTTGAFGEPMTMTRTALRQMASRVLPGRGLSFVEALRKMDDAGRKLAEINWTKFLQKQTDAALVRTIKLPGEPLRSVRAVLSQRYAIVDNLDVLDALMNNPDAAQLPVISVKITDDAMRVRLALDPSLLPEEALRIGNEMNRAGGFLAKSSEIYAKLLEGPIAMLEVWNSEVGKAAVNARIGTFKLACLNGMTGWGGDNSSWRWFHSGGAGSSDRISNGIGEALTTARVIGAGMVEAQKAAANVAIDDAFALLERWADKSLTKDQLARTQEAMLHPTSGPRNSLGSVVEGLTLAAQSESDLLAQRDMEAFAGSFLRKGFAAASDGFIRNQREEIEIPEA